MRVACRIKNWSAATNGILPDADGYLRIMLSGPSYTNLSDRTATIGKGVTKVVRERHRTRANW